MAERGYFFNGTSLGDASVAPYDASEFVAPAKLYGDFVIPNYEDELEVITSTNNGEVLVKTGAAMVQGALYETDAQVAVAITSAVNNRIDRIVLRYTDGVTKTVRVTKIIGAEAANPSPPALGATDFPLFWIWIPAGYNAATTTVSSYYIHDERVFHSIGLTDLYFSSENIMPNSEFFGYSGGAAGNLAPDNWTVYTPPNVTAINNAPLTNIPDQMRGQAVRIQAALGGMETYVDAGWHKRSEWEDTSTITLKTQIYITSGSVQIRLETFYGAAAYDTVIRQYYRTGVAQTVILRVKTSAALAAVRPAIHIEISAINNSDFYVGQVILVKGHIPGNFRPKHEIVYFDNDVLDASWNATAKSTGVTTINAATSFGGVIPPYFTALICRIRGRDSGSAAALTDACKIEWCHADHVAATNLSGHINIEGVANDYWREVVGYVPNKTNDANAPFKVIITATGVNTFDATIQPIGIIT